MHKYHYIRYHFVRRSDCTYISFYGPAHSWHLCTILHTFIHFFLHTLHYSAQLHTLDTCTQFCTLSHTFGHFYTLKHTYTLLQTFAHLHTQHFFTLSLFLHTSLLLITLLVYKSVWKICAKYMKVRNCAKRLEQLNSWAVAQFAQKWTSVPKCANNYIHFHTLAHTFAHFHTL